MQHRLRKNEFWRLLLLFLILSTACVALPKREQGAEPSMSEVLKSIEARDYNRAIAILETLHHRDPKNGEVVSHLAQLYGARAGIDSLKLYKGFYHLQETDGEKLASIEKPLQEFFDRLPPVSAQAEEDLEAAAKAYETLLANLATKGHHFYANLFFYKGLYFLYLVKSLYYEVKEIQKAKTMRQKMLRVLKTFEKEHLYALDAEWHRLVKLIDELPPLTKKVVKKQALRLRTYFYYHDEKIKVDLTKVSPEFVHQHLAKIMRYELATVTEKLADFLAEMQLSPENFQEMLSNILMLKQTPLAALAPLPRFRANLPKILQGTLPEQDHADFIEAFFQLAKDRQASSKEDS